MNTNYILDKFFLLIVATAGAVFPLCLSIDPTYTVTGINNSTKALAVTITSNSFLSGEQDSTTVDTVYQDTLLSRLTNAFSTSEVVVIAKATRAVRFVPRLVNVGDRVFESESVTVAVECALKGTIKSTWNFIHEIGGSTHTLYYDSATGQNMVLLGRVSHTIPGYNSIINQRFLLFLDKSSLPKSEVFDLPLKNGCSGSTSAYLLDSLNQIYFDGFTYLSSEKKIFAIPELRVPLEEFTSSIANNTSVAYKSFTHASMYTNNAYNAATYNLLGKRLKTGAQKSLQQSAGVYFRVSPTQNGRIFRTVISRR